MLLALAAWSCGRSPDAELPESLARLEYFVLAQPVRPGGDWLLCGRYELTLNEYLPNVDHLDGEAPATGMTLSECQAWCAPRGLRLPNDQEWTELATGGAGASWIPAPSGTRNDLELGLGRPLPVGVFERGRGPHDGYDFFGNAWERLATEPGAMNSAAGGSYAARPANATDRLELGADDRLEDVGMRYFADATRYVIEYVVPEWNSLSSKERARTGMLFERWLPDLRRSFGDHLQAQGVPVDFCQRVRDR